MLLDYIFPKYSLRGSEGSWITKSEIPYIRSHPHIFEKSSLRSRDIKNINRLFSAGNYRDCPLMRKAISTFKYKRIPGLSDYLQSILSDAIDHYFSLRENAYICPVPLHFTRLFHRGFNQAEILASKVSEDNKIPMERLLVRRRPTGNQTRRNKERRWKAMQNAFRLNRGFVEDLPYCVYLVDDLFTTGATMEECARILKNNGVKIVEGIVLAHG
ncbi:ComF family protein [Candidatus Peribacteria bacterium]|jgi:competence protein ComFC|nr:ComF family protein [Candidatus Peribacteria bacterium]MBT4021313.1 ComF family protein [Candidatus Peribacteria bacterium]MBT4241226.1 ComF family protein [Candidatus Peribacteria bacterium]MBT4474251.1 ComF family protein [Candidatus Peribacteria bacterium]